MLIRRHKKDVKEVDYTQLSYNELRSLAKAKAINTHKMSTEEIIESLNKVGE